MSNLLIDSFCIYFQRNFLYTLYLFMSEFSMKTLMKTSSYENQVQKK